MERRACPPAGGCSHSQPTHYCQPNVLFTTILLLFIRGACERAKRVENGAQVRFYLEESVRGLRTNPLNLSR